MFNIQVETVSFISNSSIILNMPLTLSQPEFRNNSVDRFLISDFTHLLMMENNMLFKELLDVAKYELEVEDAQFVKEKIKSRLREIREAKKTLDRMEKQFENFLEQEIG
jgi:hypothetical protein